jgi:hypothetical protein
MLQKLGDDRWTDTDGYTDDEVILQAPLISSK